MTDIEIVQTGLIYRNPAPYLRAEHAYFPSVAAVSENEMVASFALGCAFESVDCQVFVSRSTDEGNTWKLEGKMRDLPENCSEGNRITFFSDGELVSIINEFDRSNPEVGLTNPENSGFVPTRFLLLRSNDKGKRWSEPVEIIPPLVGPCFELCSPIVELSDGRWLFPTSTWRDWDGNEPNGMKAVGFISEDKGKSWPEYVDIMDGAKDKIIFWEQKTIEIDGGRLLSAAWTFDEKAGADRVNHYAVSSMDKMKFSSPRPTDLQGQTPSLLHLSDGKILCAYRRMDKLGLWAALVNIDSEGNWETLTQKCLWSPALPPKNDKDMGIVEHFQGLKFGAPCMLKLTGGDVYLAFWCVEDCVSNIRWIRIAVKA